MRSCQIQGDQYAAVSHSGGPGCALKYGGPGSALDLAGLRCVVELVASGRTGTWMIRAHTYT